MAKKKSSKLGDAWAEAKRRCRLSAEDIRMAKALGMTAKSLLKNVPSSSQQWKAPVKVWIRDLYHKRFGSNQVRENAADARADVVETLEAVHDIDLPADALRQEVNEENRMTEQIRCDWIKVAKYVTHEMRKFEFVVRVALFGSLASPPKLECSRYRRLRRAGTVMLHRPKDIDLAVWVNDLTDLKSLQKARSRAVDRFISERGWGPAHHQIDVFILEPGSDRYLGRLCTFGTCPKEGKHECRVPGCGASRFLRQHEEFEFYPDAMDPKHTMILFDRTATTG